MKCSDVSKAVASEVERIADRAGVPETATFAELTSSGISVRLADRFKVVRCEGLESDALTRFAESVGVEKHALTDSETLEEVTVLYLHVPARRGDDLLDEAETYVLLEAAIAEGPYQHIVVSYFSDSGVSRGFAERVLKRQGITSKTVTVPCEDVDCGRTVSVSHAVRDGTPAVYESPINYTGNKAPLAAWLRENQPVNVGTVYDLFGGGLNASINFDAERVVYNDLNFFVKELLEMFRDSDTAELYVWLRQSIEKYGLSRNNKEAYMAVRADYNSAPVAERDSRLLFLCAIYGFNNQLRFNSNHGFNNPVGLGGFTDSTLEKVVSFSRVLKSREVEFQTGNYLDAVSLNSLGESDFVYLDPPYLITLGSYNDGKRGFGGWTRTHELELLGFIDQLDGRGVKFMLSNVVEHKGVRNELLEEWLAKNPMMVAVDYAGGSSRGRKEVLVKNY